MMVFSEQPKPVEKINYKDINFLSQQLEALIKVYKKKVLMDDDRYHMIMAYLEDISNRLKAGRYDTLIADTSIISFKDEDEDDYPF